MLPPATASTEPTKGLNPIQGTSKVSGESQEEPPSRWRAWLRPLPQPGELFPSRPSRFFSGNMWWLPIKRQQLPLKQAALCKAARGTLLAGPGSPGRFMRCHLRDLQFPGTAVQVQPAGMGGAGNGSQAQPGLQALLCSEPQAPKPLQSGTSVAKSTRFLAGLQAGAAQAQGSSLSHPFGCSQLSPH